MPSGGGDAVGGRFGNCTGCPEESVNSFAAILGRVEDLAGLVRITDHGEGQAGGCELLREWVVRLVPDRHHH